MDLEYKVISDAEGFDAFRSLLKSSNLPADDLDYRKDLLVGYYESDAMVGTGGLEIYGPYALLRSLSVKMGIRGKSVGSTIYQFLLDEAKRKKLKAIYILTETAHGFFRKKGFQEVKREDVPEEVKKSSEFSSVCATTAAVMMLSI